MKRIRKISSMKGKIIVLIAILCVLLVAKLAVAITTIVPDSDIDQGYWWPSTGSDVYAVLDEGYDSYSDSDYADDYQGGVLKMGLSNPSLNDGGYIFRVRNRDKSGSGNYSVRKSDDTLIMYFETTSGSSYTSHVSDWSSLTSLTSTELQNLEIWIDGTSYPSVSVVDVQIDEAACSPTLNQDWEISDKQVCDGKEVTAGTGSIIIQSGGSLILKNAANVTSSGFEIRRTGDCTFIYPDSELRIS